MSTWIFFEPGENAASLPVTRSSKRAPMLIIRSQSCIAWLDSNMPCMPTMPSDSGSDAGKAPRPIRVCVQGKPVRRTNSVSSCEAAVPELTTPPPM